MNSNQTSTIIFSSNRQFTLYLLSLLSIALSIGVTMAMYLNINRFSLEFQSTLKLSLFVFFLIAIGNIFLICFLWMSGRYVLEIKLISEKDIEIKTWSIIGFNQRKIYDLSILDNKVYHRGKYDSRLTVSVDAPYFTIKTPKGKKLLLDMAGFLHQSIDLKNINFN